MYHTLLPHTGEGILGTQTVTPGGTADRSPARICTQKKVFVDSIPGFQLCKLFMLFSMRMFDHSDDN